MNAIESNGGDNILIDWGRIQRQNKKISKSNKYINPIRFWIGRVEQKLIWIQLDPNYIRIGSGRVKKSYLIQFGSSSVNNC